MSDFNSSKNIVALLLFIIFTLFIFQYLRVQKVEIPQRNYLLKIREKLIDKYITYTSKADIVMLGDSHTAHGYWNIWLKDYKVKRIATGGYTSSNVLTHIAEVPIYKPKYVFIQVGCNDVIKKDFDLSNTFNNYKEIIKRLKSSGIHPIFVSVFPQLDRPKKNLILQKMNKEIQDICRQTNLDFIDVYSDFKGDRGIKEEFTYDRTHLTMSAYHLWVERISNYLNNRKYKKNVSELVMSTDLND